MFVYVAILAPVAPLSTCIVSLPPPAKTISSRPSPVTSPMTNPPSQLLPSPDTDHFGVRMVVACAEANSVEIRLMIGIATKSIRSVVVCICLRWGLRIASILKNRFPPQKIAFSTVVTDFSNIKNCYITK